MSFRRCLAFVLPILLASVHADAADITEISTGYSTSSFDEVVTLHKTSLVPILYTTTIVGADGSTITSKLCSILLKMAADRKQAQEYLLR